MATKLQRMSELSIQTINGLTHSIDAWLRFLDSAAWLYKYPFPDQVLIHAQRPDARACAPMELWNNTFRRWVTSALLLQLSSEYEILLELPTRGKDYNDQLLFERGLPKTIKTRITQNHNKEEITK